MVEAQVLRNPPNACALSWHDVPNPWDEFDDKPMRRAFCVTGEEVVHEGGPRRKLAEGQPGLGYVRPFHDHRA